MFAVRSCMKLSKTEASCTLRFYRRNKSTFYRGVQFFKNNLLLANSITSGGFVGIGDLIQQEFEYQANLIPKRYDWPRAGRMCLVGTLMGPIHHFYYLYLDKFMPKTDAKTVLTKVLWDQIVCSPITIIFFFYAMGTLEGKSFQECYDEIAKKFKYVMMGDWLFWPPVQIINFYYLPSHFRVVYINLATMIYNVFISYMKHYDQHEI